VGFGGWANTCDVDAARDEMVTTDRGLDPLLVHRLPDLGLDRALAHPGFREPIGVCAGHGSARSLAFVTDKRRDRGYVLDTVSGEAISRSDWNPGNAIVILITGDTTTKSSSRTAESYDGTPSQAPVLHVEFVRH